MNPLEKEFAKYPEALELKELGFDEPCFGYYNTMGFNRYFDNIKNSDNLIESENIKGNWCTAPTYSQAFRWFREKYGLRFRNYVFVNYSGGISEGFEIFKYSKDTIDSIEALTYEQAELACLRKLIEIVKTNKNG